MAFYPLQILSQRQEKDRPIAPRGGHGRASLPGDAVGAADLFSDLLACCAALTRCAVAPMFWVPVRLLRY